MEEIITTDTKLRTLRIGRNWSQEEIAYKMGISQAAYAKLESGKTRLTIDRAKLLAEIYDIEPEYFFSAEKTVHNNLGNNSHSNSGYINTYTQVIMPQETFDKLLAENKEVVALLKGELAEAKKERDILLDLIKKISKTEI